MLGYECPLIDRKPIISNEENGEDNSSYHSSHHSSSLTVLIPNIDVLNYPPPPFFLSPNPSLSLLL